MSKPGTILKVVVHNFVTYDYIKFIPRLNLNLILGPNGTGKSTLVAAIILGLGGTPKDIGRGTNIQEYIKYSKETAIIELTLQGNNENERVIIVRKFNTFNKSTWTINNKPVNKDQVLACATKFNIQVNNLCQFLPQDKVQDFSKLNRHELLHETQIALCRLDLVELQNKACEYSNLLHEKNEKLKKRENHLKELESKREQLSSKVENYNKRKKQLIDVKNIDGKIAWMKYNDIAEECNTKLNDKLAADTILAIVNKQVTDVPRGMSKAKIHMKNITTEIENYKTPLRESLQEGSTTIKRIKSLKEQIKEFEADRDNKIHNLLHIHDEIMSIRLDIKQLTDRHNELLNSFGNEEQLKNKVEQYYGEMRNLKRNIFTYENKKQGLLNRRNELIVELKQLKQKDIEKQNIYQKRLDWLKSRDEDVFKAVKWLEQNKHRFRDRIYEPMVLNLNVFDIKNAIYLENTIPMTEKLAFICVNIPDMNLFINLMETEVKLNVNVVYSKPDAKISNYQPRVPIEELNKFGFHSYLGSLYEAPESVMTYLCDNYNLHNIPIGSSSTIAYMDTIPESIQFYFTENNRFSVIRSEYSGEKITTKSIIKSNGSFSMVTNTIAIEHAKGKVISIKNEMDSIDENMTIIKTDEENLLKQEKQFKEEIKKIEEVKASLKSMTTHIEIKNKQLTEKQQSNKNQQQIEDDASKKIKDAIKTMTECYEKLAQIKENCDKPHKAIALLSLSFESTRQDVIVFENVLKDITKKYNEKLSIVNQIKSELEETERRKQNAYKNAQDLTDGLGEDDHDFIKYKNIFEKLPNLVDELLEKRKITLTLANLINPTELDEIKEYDVLLKNINMLEKQIERNRLEKANISEEKLNYGNLWLTPLTELIATINEKFSSYFKIIGCAGEVSLFTNDGDDYNQYGLSVMVSFRSNIPMQDLNSRVHSGGETAVTTALFMLSLQDLTPVPFRCVDEINQGMDESNERLVYKLLFDITQKPNCTQYFVVSPKLISKLEYNENTNASIIFG